MKDEHVILFCICFSLFIGLIITFTIIISDTVIKTQALETIQTLTIDDQSKIDLIKEFLK